MIWAWHAPDGRRDGAVVTGSHLDSVPGGGPFDGPLGRASALVAFDHLDQTVAPRPRAIAVFPEEEGSRFGVACLGSRLMTGAIDPARALALTDEDGTTFADAAARSGLDPARVGPNLDVLARIDSFVELHVEQGRGLIDLGRPVAVASSILGHGRWRISVTGEGNHAGTTLMGDRRDPMVVAAAAVLRVRDLARARPDARATVGRLTPLPGGTNVIASRVDLWLDVRHPQDEVTLGLVEEIREAAALAAAEEGCGATLHEESFSGTVDFDPALRDRLVGVLDGGRQCSSFATRAACRTRPRSMWRTMTRKWVPSHSRTRLPLSSDDPSDGRGSKARKTAAICSRRAEQIRICDHRLPHAKLSARPNDGAASGRKTR